jgi:hypothetical protein
VKEIYVSTDIETDGPIPGPNSMLNFASAAFLADKTLLSTFTTNLEILPDASGDPDTMKWWEEHPDAWNAHRQDLEAPRNAMHRYLNWIKSLPGKPVFVGYPAGFDFLFVYWYLIRLTGESPFSFSATAFCGDPSGGDARSVGGEIRPRFAVFRSRSYSWPQYCGSGGAGALQNFYRESEREEGGTGSFVCLDCSDNPVADRPTTQ